MSPEFEVDPSEYTSEFVHDLIDRLMCYADHLPDCTYSDIRYCVCGFDSVKRELGEAL